jgi:hypothetical protein
LARAVGNHELASREVSGPHRLPLDSPGARRRLAADRAVEREISTPYFCLRRGIGPSWRSLPPALRSYARAFLSEGGSTGCTLATLHAAPEAAVADVRTAFPGLTRRLVEVNAGDRLLLKLECEGVHEGPWRGFISPTGRYVLFEERHVIAIRDGRVDTDFVAFDFGSILRQICTGSGRRR